MYFAKRERKANWKSLGIFYLIVLKVREKSRRWYNCSCFLCIWGGNIGGAEQWSAKVSTNFCTKLYKNLHFLLFPLCTLPASLITSSPQYPLFPPHRHLPNIVTALSLIPPRHLLSVAATFLSLRHIVLLHDGVLLTTKHCKIASRY